MKINFLVANVRAWNILRTELKGLLIILLQRFNICFRFYVLLFMILHD